MPINLPEVTSGYNLSLINDNFQTIESQWDEKLDRLVSTQANQMEQELDMNSNKIINHPPTDLEEPTDLVRVDALNQFGDFTGSIPAVASYVGDGVTTAFPKPVNANDARTFQVYVGGLRQEPYTDYFITDSSVVFIQAPVLEVSVDIYGFSPVLIENAAPVYADPILANFTGDGTTTNFFVSAPGSSTDACFISIDGVNQTPFADFTNAGGAISFNEAPPLNSEIFVRIFAPFTNNATDSLVIADGSTEARTLGNRFTDFVNLKDFGTAGSGLEDDTSAIQEAVNASAGKFIIGNPSDTYRLDSLITTSESLIFDGRGCSIVLNGDAGFDVNYPHLNTTSITTITSTQAMLDGGTVNSDVTVLTVSDASGYEKDDVIKIISDDIILGEDPSRERRKAEFMTVADVTGNDITLYARLRDTYTTTPRLCKVDTSKSLVFKNVNFLTPDVVDPTWSTPAINIVGAYKPSIENIHGEALLERCLRLVSCVEPTSKNISANNIRTSIANNAFGYLIHEVGCVDGRHLSPIGRNVRHVYTNSAASVSLAGTVENYGGTRGTKVYFGLGVNCQASAFDTHADAEDCEFISCQGKQPYWGSNGLLLNFGIRGRRNKCTSCISIGGKGFRAFTDYGDSDNSRDHEFSDCKHIANGDEEQAVEAFAVLGQVGGFCTAIVENCTIENTGNNAKHFQAAYGNIRVLNPTMRDSNTTGTTESVIRANTSGTISITGGLLNYSGSLGTNLAVAEVMEDSSTVDISNMRIVIAGADVQNLLRFNNNNGIGYIRNVDMSEAPSNPSGYGAVGGSATIGIDYKINDSRDGTRAQAGTLAVVGGSNSIDTLFRYGNHLRFPINSTSASADIDSISDGLKVGQKLTINLISSSAEQATVVNTGNIDIGSDVILSAGESLTLWWDGTAWTRS